ncbi:MAG: homoserine dehydrogenase [Elusimicrobiota bacterium]|jgi:homoserine dehydrogenase|nr:homoserine dehydrogenase [Elusimicrobiota bacterium]
MNKKQINVGLIGYGTVGKGVARILEANQKIVLTKVGKNVRIKSICDRNPIDRADLYVKNFKDIIRDPEIDLVVELIGGYEPARTIIIESLKAGKSVVTANKAVLAKYWDQIFTTAQDEQKAIYYEASVGGVIPVVQGLNEGLAVEEILEIKGILNGTTNFILSKMTKEGISYEDALKKAQVAGFAEADPSFDVNGIDTANKLAILASLAWGGWIKVKNIATKGISNLQAKDVHLTKDIGCIKLVGSAIQTKNGIDLSVEPRLVYHKHTFATVDNEYNAIMVRGKDCGDVLFYGKGAGQSPAASAVVSDIVNLSKFIVTNTAGIVTDVIYNRNKKIKILPAGDSGGEYYLRFTLADKPGMLAKLCGILGENKVSIASLTQPNINKGDFADVVILTHKTQNSNLENSIKKLKSLKSIVKTNPVKLKIEK